MGESTQQKLELTMRTPFEILAAAAFAALPLAGSATAQAVIADGYYAYGAAPSGYYAYGAVPDGYYAYGRAPGYRIAPRYRQWNFGNGSAATAPGSSPMCPPDLEPGSAYPSWMCR